MIGLDFAIGASFVCLRGTFYGARRYLLPSVLPFYLSAIGCGNPNENGNVRAVYSKGTGKLSELTINAVKDGKPNVFSYMNGASIIRIEIDNDEDGKIDRWEYYGDDQRILKAGYSRANDGKPDAWAFQAPDGTIARIEVSTKRDGKPNRIEFYENETLVRAEEDTNGDGGVDKWEVYRGGALVSVSFDTTKSGKPTETIDYSREASSDR